MHTDSRYCRTCGGDFGRLYDEPIQCDVCCGAERQAALMQPEIDRLKSLLNAPEIHDFARGVVLEAAHQRQRWGSAHDAGKTDADWFWLVGYLGGKALTAALAGNREKALHHTISTAAALANWHAALLGADTSMRPGIEPPKEADHA